MRINPQCRFQNPRLFWTRLYNYMWRVTVRKQESYENNVSGANASYMLKTTLKRILCNSLRVEIEISPIFWPRHLEPRIKLLRHFHSLLLRRFVFRMIEESAKREWPVTKCKRPLEGSFPPFTSREKRLGLKQTSPCIYQFRAMKRFPLNGTRSPPPHSVFKEVVLG